MTTIDGCQRDAVMGWSRWQSASWRARRTIALVALLGANRWRAVSRGAASCPDRAHSDKLVHGARGAGRTWRVAKMPSASDATIATVDASDGLVPRPGTTTLVP